VKGFFLRRPSWFTQPLRPEHARDEAALMEMNRAAFTKLPRNARMMLVFDSYSATSPR